MKNWMKAGILAVFISVMYLFPAYAGEWKQEQPGGKWWYQEDGGLFPTNKWKWIDGNWDGIAECYCFDGYGYLYTAAATPDGYQVNEGGAWTVEGVAQTKSVLPGSTQDCQSQVKKQEGNIQSQKNAENGQKTWENRQTEDGEASGYVPDRVRIAEYVIELVNEERTKRGLSILETNEELMENASVRAEEVRESFSHIRPDGRRYSSVITVENTKNGENIMSASAFESDLRTAEYLMELWMDSVSHKNNLLNSGYLETGVGIEIVPSVWDGYTVYNLSASQLFIR